MQTIHARAFAIDGTQIERGGMETVRANRAENVRAGVPPMEKKGDGLLKDEPVAIVGYGPSLNATWPRLKEFKTIWTVSKAHDFLVDRGIVPTYHLDLDPRVHKVEFMTKPQKGTQYFLSSHVHPTYPPKLLAAGVDVKMFHVAIDKHEKLDSRYPQLKVRFDAGIQAAEAAFVRGYRNQHWFGIEYGHADDGNTHAGMHWGVTSEKCVVEVDGGRKFISSALFFHGLMLAEQFLCDRALVRCTLHGDGLLGHFMKARGRAKFKHLI